MKIPAHLIAHGVTTRGGIVYFTTDATKAERAEGTVHRCYKNCAFGHVHLSDAIIYWCRVDHLSRRVFK